VEMFLDPLGGFRSTFDRCADLVCESSAEFRRRMKRAAEKPLPLPSEGICDDCAVELSAPAPGDGPSGDGCPGSTLKTQ